MRLGKLCGVPIRISPMAFPMMALAWWLGEGNRMLVMSMSILFHELMHAAVARLLRVRVIEIELMPCGGAARLENLWRLRPAQVMIVALAGPIGNIFLMVLAAALCWWGWLSPEWTALCIEQNAVIFMFNMLPALPMDGGRILCGWLSRRLSGNTAAKVGMCTAVGLSLFLLGVSVLGIMQGRLNITIPMAALFLLFSAHRERRQSECAAIESLTGRSTELSVEQVLPVRFLAVKQDATVRETAVHLKPRCVHMIAVYDDEMELVRVVGERQLTNALLRDWNVEMIQIGEKIDLNQTFKKVEKT